MGVFRVTLTAHLLGVLAILYLHPSHALSPGTMGLWHCQESTRCKLMLQLQLREGDKPFGFRLPL